MFKGAGTDTCTDCEVERFEARSATAEVQDLLAKHPELGSAIHQVTAHDYVGDYGELAVELLAEPTPPKLISLFTQVAASFYALGVLHQTEGRVP